MNIVINILLLIGSFLMMEFVAWFTHKYVMHGFLWCLHKDHHQPPQNHLFQKNDYFFLIFALPGIVGIFYGVGDFRWSFWCGLGISVYGVAYFLIHDIFIHQRSKFFKKSSIKYLQSLRKAHKIHHKNINKDHGENFGMLFFPLKYWK